MPISTLLAFETLYKLHLCGLPLATPSDVGGSACSVNSIAACGPPLAAFHQHQHHRHVGNIQIFGSATKALGRQAHMTDAQFDGLQCS